MEEWLNEGGVEERWVRIIGGAEGGQGPAVAGRGLEASGGGGGRVLQPCCFQLSI